MGHILLRGGTVVTADAERRADVLVSGETIAAVGADLFADVETAADQMVKVTRIIEPNPSTHSVYRPFYESYKATYLTLRNLRKPIEP